MLAQFKIMILSIFMAGNTAVTEPSINMDNIENIKEVACLSQAVHGEAGNQSFEGKVAVAHVILNRARDENFPDTPCAVIKQPGQFDFKPRKLYPEKNPALQTQMEESIQAAVAAMNGNHPDPTKGALFFANPKISTDQAWLKRLKKLVKIDEHVFYVRKNSPRYARSVEYKPQRVAMNSD